MFANVNHTPRYIPGRGLPPGYLANLKGTPVKDRLEEVAHNNAETLNWEEELRLASRRSTPLAIPPLLPHLLNAHLSLSLTLVKLIQCLKSLHGRTYTSSEASEALLGVFGAFIEVATLASWILDDTVALAQAGWKLAHAIFRDADKKEATRSYWGIKEKHREKWERVSAAVIGFAVEVEAGQEEILLGITSEDEDSHQLHDALLTSTSILEALLDTLKDIWDSESLTTWDSYQVHPDPVALFRLQSNWVSLRNALAPPEGPTLGQTMRAETRALLDFGYHERFFRRLDLDKMKDRLLGSPIWEVGGRGEKGAPVGKGEEGGEVEMQKWGGRDLEQMKELDERLKVEEWREALRAQLGEGARVAGGRAHTV